MPRVIQAVNAQRRGEPTEVEYRVMQAGGLVRWLSTRAFPVPDDTGRVCRIAGITEDITQRKRAEESLLLAAEGVTGTGERFFQSLVENLATLLDLEHVQLVVPDGLRGFRVLAGFSWGEHVASGGSDPIPEPSAQVMEEGLVLYREGLGEVFPDNERLREIEAQSYLGILLVDSVGRRLGVLCAVHGRRLQEADLVERIFRVFASRCAAEIERARAEQALGERMSFERLVTQVSNRFVYLQHDEIDRGMAEALGEIGRFAAVDLAGVFVFDWERRVAVRTCAWSSGGEPEAEAPRSIDERPWFLERLRADGFVHVADPSDLPPEAAALAAELRANGSRSLTSVSMVSRGELRGYLALESAGSSRVLSPDGVVLLRLLAETLANALERKGADLEREQLAAQLRQSQKMEAIGTLAGGVAHDFNNLLTAILAEAALLKETEPRDERVLAAAAIVEAAGRRAKDLTDQLLGYARQGKTENVLVDVSEIVSGVVRLLGRTISKSIAIESELCPDRAAVLGDPGQMQQVLLNLALNARDAMPRGGTLRFETELRPEVEGDPGEARRLEIRVRDTGSGIPEGDLERIFEPFFTTKDPGKGTGMGLAMVFGIVQNHGGSIRAENVSGGGALFRIVLPVASGIAVNRAVREERAPQRGSGRVLIVDDEPIVLNVARQLLRHLGYEVLTANGGEEAVQVWRARGSEIDLVLLDLLMPRMDGRETLRELRRMDPGAKVLLTSGWGLEGSARELLEEGILGIVRKPYEIAELSILVADAVGMERNSDLVPRPAPALRAAAGLSGGSARREG
jgi:signal transduction histidine kinase/ActR/RegA family two-component response regulator